MAIREVSPKILEEFEEARSELVQTLEQLTSDAPSDQGLVAFVTASQDYMEAVNRELELVKKGAGRVGGDTDVGRVSGAHPRPMRKTQGTAPE